MLDQRNICYRVKRKFHTCQEVSNDDDLVDNEAHNTTDISRCDKS